MSKGLEALGKITGTQNLTMYEQNECLKIIEKELEILHFIEDTFTFRNALLKVCDENSKVFPNRHKAIKEYLLKYELPNKQIGALSKGNIQKLGILQVILSDGDLYLLDEPTDGLDKKSIDTFILDIKQLLINNKTIIISTHKKSIYNELKPVVYKFESGVCNEKRKKSKTN